ncbi:carboxypeptidase-like regulatory domain-containing protein [Desulfosarcina sp.]|nr:carboxypeptidase-like regulatory domain-containing protein [Desulfosarcina sp.]
MENCKDRNFTGVVSPLGQPYYLLPLLLTGLLLIPLLSACSYPSIKSRDSLASERFDGTIVDKETGEPIPKAVVMMRWPRISGGYTGSNTVGAIEVSESVTDGEGRYFIEGWTKGKAEIFEGGFVYKTSPEMVIYAPGYWPLIKRNRTYTMDPTEAAKRQKKSINILQNGEVWKADWNGEAIVLEPTHSETWNPEQWGKYLSSIESHMSISYMPQCPWLKLPSYFLARDRVIRKSYQLAHPSWNHTVGSTLRSILTKWRVRLENECGVDPKSFFLSHGMTKEEFELCCSDTQDNKNNASVM